MKLLKAVFCLVLMFTFYSFTLYQPDKAVMQRGKKVYDTYCLACHQVDGAGVPRMNPPLIKTPYVLGDKKKLINVVLKGLNEEVEINGEVYENPMPAQPQLTDQQIADVLTFVRNSFGNRAGILTVAEVKAERAKLKKK
jgi:mono/diheme cytochrome c family protein